jgi:hypothetical protein
MNGQRIITSAALLLITAASFAQDSDPAESTIRLMGAAEAETPEAVTREISIPDNLREDHAAVEKAEQGIATANDNRAKREEGLSRADEARDKGANMAEEARENRETRGRSGDRPDPPDPPQGPPGD